MRLPIQTVARSDAFLQRRWGKTRTDVLAGCPRDVRAAIQVEWFDTACGAPVGDIAAAFRLTARANHHASRRADELAESLATTALDEGAVVLKSRRLARPCVRMASVDAMRRLAEAEGLLPPDPAKHEEVGQRK